MKRHRKKKQNKHFFSTGLTMIEAMIVMAIALPIMMAFMGAFNSLSKSQARTNDLESVQFTMTNLIHDFSQEVHAADTFEVHEGNPFDEIILTSLAPSSEPVSYTVADGQMIKNHQPFSQKDVELQMFQVENVAPSGVPLLHVTITLSSKRSPEVQLTQQVNISLRQNHVEPTLSPVMNKLSF